MKQQDPRRYIFVAELDTQQDLRLLMDDHVFKTLLKGMEHLAAGEVVEANYFEIGHFRRWTSHWLNDRNRLYIGASSG